jgi:hypothetical protein
MVRFCRGVSLLGDGLLLALISSNIGRARAFVQSVDLGRIFPPVP